MEGHLTQRVVALAGRLRDVGVPVSSAEIIDAVRTLPLLPLERREELRAALAAALLKEPTRRAAFDRLFETYFPRAPVPAPAADMPGSDGDDLVEALREGDDARVRVIARGRVEQHADIRPEAPVGEDAYVFRAMRGLNLDAVLSALRDEAVEGLGQGALQRRMIGEDLEQRIERFREMLREEVFARLLDALGPDAMAQRDRRPPPDEVDFLWARESDVEAMRAALAPLARALALTLARKRRRARRGRLDVRATVRRSLGSGGVFVEPRFRRAATGKPDLVVVCDVSGSMRAFAKFTLELLYALSTQFLRVRSFAFIDALDEVTHLLTVSSDLAGALERIEREARLVHADGQSWYGHCLEQLASRIGNDLAANSTLIIVGDARNNFRSTGVEYLLRMRERARRIYFLNPEPRAHWNAGDSVVAAFEPACDGVFEVRNLRQLKHFVGTVLAGASRT